MAGNAFLCYEISILIKPCTYRTVKATVWQPNSKKGPSFPLCVQDRAESILHGTGTRSSDLLFIIYIICLFAQERITM